MQKGQLPPTDSEDSNRRRAAEEELQREKIFTNAVMDSVPGLLYLYDEYGRLVRWNKKHEEMTGYSAEELSQKQITDWFRGEEVEYLAAQIKRVFTDGHTDGEGTLLTKEGKAIPFYFTGVRLILDGKKYLAGIGIDITNWKKAEDALRKLSQAIEQSPVNVVITDVQGNIEYANPRFCQVTGYTLAEALGKNPRILKSGHTSDEEYRALWQTITAGGEWSGEFLNKAKDGTLFWERAKITSIKDEAGRITHFLAVKEDITEQKKVEETLQQMRMQLTHVARLSTLGEMVAELAHELNHPLYAILNYAKASRNLLAEEGLADLNSLREWNEEIAAIASSAGEVVRRLRSFAGRTESLCAVCDLEEIVEEALGLFAVEIRSSGVTIETSFPDVLPPVQVDRVQIQQILINLLSNAVEAMETTSSDIRRITIRTSVCDKEIEVSVSDRGAGLPSGSEATIFKPFVSTKPHGLGIGLSIVRTIVEAHGGRLWATSNLEGGATFHFTLPLAAC